MNKSELIAAIAEKTGLSRKDSEKALTATFDILTAALQAGERVQLFGFGVFETRERPARMGHNPRTMEEIAIPASRSPVFKAGKALKDAVEL